MNPVKTSMALGASLFSAGASGATWISHGNAVIGIIAGIVSLICARWFIRVQREQARYLRAQAVHEEMRICADCAKGNPPTQCPLPDMSNLRDCLIKVALNRASVMANDKANAAASREKP